MVGVKNAGQGIVVEINADQFLNIVAQYRVVLCRGFDGLVDFLNGGVAAGDKAEVHQRHVDGGHPHGQAVELAVQVRYHFANGCSSAGLGQDQIGRASCRERVESSVGEGAVQE